MPTQGAYITDDRRQTDVVGVSATVIYREHFLHNQVVINCAHYTKISSAAESIACRGRIKLNVIEIQLLLLNV